MNNELINALQTQRVGIIIEPWKMTDQNHEVVALSCHPHYQ
jgi:hypothetical protein